MQLLLEEGLPFIPTQTGAIIDLRRLTLEFTNP